MLWREDTTRGYFLGQLADDLDEALTKAPEPPSEVDEVGLDSVLAQAEGHLDRLAATLAPDLPDRDATPVDRPAQSLATIIDEPEEAAAMPTKPVPRTRRRRAITRPSRNRRSRVAVLVAVIAVLLAGAALYVRARAGAEDTRARRPTSTSIEELSTPTTTVGSVEAAPETDPASSVVPGAPSSTPQGTNSSTSRGTGTRAPASSASSPAPNSGGSSPSNSASPSSPPPRSPTCQLLPVLCP